MATKSKTKKAAPKIKEATRTKKPAAKTTSKATKKVALLSGGNPQIAKDYGDAPVQAYISAMPDWKSAVGRKIDSVITKSVPRVQKAVKWNSPLYGMEGQGWFLSFHCFAKYIKIAFFRGAQLKPEPPVGSKTPSARYLHIFEDQPLDEKQFVAWVKQASKIPGEKM